MLFDEEGQPQRCTGRQPHYRAVVTGELLRLMRLSNTRVDQIQHASVNVRETGASSVP
jgi:hypothetical protein